MRPSRVASAVSSAGTFDGSVVRLEGFPSQPSGSLTAIGWDRRRTTLLVVPPETGSDAAQRALTAAADPDHTDDSTELPAGQLQS